MPYTPFYPTWHNSGVALDTPITGDALNHIDAGIATAQATAEAAGGSPQIAAKSTDATPYNGEPGLYAAASTAPADGGWLAADINNDYVELAIGTHDNPATRAGLYAEKSGATDWDSALSAYATHPTNGHTAAVVFTAQATARGDEAQLRFNAGAASLGLTVDVSTDNPDDTPGVGHQTTVDIAGGTGTAQVADILTVRTAVEFPLGTPDASKTLLAVDGQSLKLFSPNGTGWRVTVDDSGALTVTAA